MVYPLTGVLGAWVSTQWGAYYIRSNTDSVKRVLPAYKLLIIIISDSGLRHEVLRKTKGFKLTKYSVYSSQIHCAYFRYNSQSLIKRLIPTGSLLSC